ncbi:8328_t:CDS:2, partial [Funneliformis geosporum]
TGSVVEMFEHTLRTNELIRLQTIQHELLNIPNDVIPVSKYEFYVTNDHYYNRSPWKYVEALRTWIYTPFIFTTMEMITLISIIGE